MNSASAWLRAPATRTSWPSASCGLTFRATRWRSDTCSSAPGLDSWLSGSPQARQKRSVDGYEAPQPEHTSRSASITPQQLGLGHAAVVDRPGADDRLRRRQSDDHPQHAGPPHGEADVGLRRHRIGARVGVIDRAQLEARVLDLAVVADLLASPRSRIAAGSPRRWSLIDFSAVAVARREQPDSTRSAPPGARARSSGRRGRAKSSSGSLPDRGY